MSRSGSGWRPQYAKNLRVADKSSNVVLKAGQRTKQFHSGRITAEGGAIAAREVGVKPGSGWSYVFWYVLKGEGNPRTASQSKGSRDFLIFAAQAFS